MTPETSAAAAASVKKAPTTNVRHNLQLNERRWLVKTSFLVCGWHDVARMSDGQDCHVRLDVNHVCEALGVRRLAAALLVCRNNVSVPVSRF
ncbi:MAG: hypothetical protein GX456_13295 [Verrucomicrobia bacterium]|nr:hypothetical protein [Verrucomicrobiota bacterium]